MARSGEATTSQTWRTLKFNIATIMGMGLSGCATMGSTSEAEMLVGWIQNGIFQPRFCMNPANNGNTVTQPWMYEEYLPEVQAAFAQRYRMIPCLCSLMHEAAVPGVPGRQEVLQRQAPGFHARSGGAGG